MDFIITIHILQSVSLVSSIPFVGILEDNSHAFQQFYVRYYNYSTQLGTVRILWASKFQFIKLFLTFLVMAYICVPQVYIVKDHIKRMTLDARRIQNWSTRYFSTENCIYTENDPV